MPHSRYLFIVNPVAASGAAATRFEALASQRATLDHDVAFTEAPGHATEIAAHAHGYDVVVAFGGDGTTAEIVNGLMQIADEERPVLALLPCGSGNDSCRMAGVPLTIDAAFEVLRTGTPRSFDLGLCNDTYFVNSFSTGVDAQVVTRTHELKEATGHTGFALYGRALIDVILRNMKATIIEVTRKGSDDRSDVDGAATRHDVLLCTVTNGQTYGSGFRINPSARPDDGTLTMSHIAWIPRWRVLSLLPALMRATHPRVKHYRVDEVIACTVTNVTDEPLVAQCDGEIVRERTFAISVRPQALRILV
ncbi:MAG: diacylglycerol kinase family lipid kinase [Coriobacteriia bacterium]|nr:diacylglycerol kinase family lipid kinase [Coriobacteriia bacterium]